eukprot:COSAG01_NODE_4650_length_4850_cov_2.236211_2_plen_87_part_00
MLACQHRASLQLAGYVSLVSFGGCPGLAAPARAERAGACRTQARAERRSLARVRPPPIRYDSQSSVAIAIANLQLQWRGWGLAAFV